MKSYFEIVFFIFGLYCSPEVVISRTEASVTSRTDTSCIKESENVQDATPCLETGSNKSVVSTSEYNNILPPEISSPSPGNSQTTTTETSRQANTVHTTGQSKTVESVRQTKKSTTTNMPRTTLNTQNTERNGEQGSHSSGSVSNNNPSGGNSIPEDDTGIKEATTKAPTKSFITERTTPSAVEFKNGGSRTDGVQNSRSDLINVLLKITAPYCQESLCVFDSASNCYCDESCYFYNDCCYSMIENLLKKNDSETRHLADLVHGKVQELENKTIMFRKDLIQCTGDADNKSAFIIVGRCDRLINSSDDLVEKCESSVEWYNIHNIPVDHVINGKVLATFKNLFCALCNGVSQNETVFWNINITCDVENLETVAQMELEEIALIEKCSLQPYSMFINSLRKCLIGQTSFKNCDKHGNDELINLCHTYLYPLTDVIDPVLTIPNTYRNPHCASCTTEKLNVSHFRCVDLFYEDNRFKPEHINGHVDLQVFFDFSRDKGIVSKVMCVAHVNCKTFEIYDCASERCRQLYCQIDETPFEGKCIKTNVVRANIAIDQAVDTARPLDKFDNLTNGGDIFILEIISDDGIDLIFYALRTTGERILNTISETIKKLQPHVIKTDTMRECTCLLIEMSSEQVFSEIFHILVHTFEKLEEKGQHGYSIIPLFIKIRNFQSLSSMECTNGKLMTEKVPSLVGTNSSISPDVNSSIVFMLPSLAMTVNEQNCIWEVSYDKNIGVVSSLVASCLIFNDRPNLNCSMVAYGLEEVQLSDSSMQIINTSFTFNEDEFVVFQGQVFICTDRVTRIESFVNIFTFSADQRILSLVTSSISALSAAGIVVAHVCLKHLRNIHGLNLSALSVSTFLMHFLLLVQSTTISRTVCVIYSVVLHFVLLNIFVWMNIIGYDMTRIFVSNEIASYSAPFKRFLGYAFVSLLFPSLITAVAASLDFTDSAFKPNYGDRDVCWLSSGKGIIVFVIGPVVLSLLLNFGFFSFTVKAISSKARQTKFARNRSYFIVYLKLTLILGLTWIVGIIGAFVKQEWLWILHLVLNGLQGLSLLICSVVNVRNIRQLRTSLKLTTVSSNSKLSKAAVTENSYE